MLFSLEQENVDAIARAPNITTTPVSDHISLPLGETVQIRWDWEGDGGTEQAAVAYAFAADDMLMVCLFQSLPETVATYEPESEAIIGTFKPKGFTQFEPAARLAGVAPSGPTSLRDAWPYPVRHDRPREA